MVEIHWGWLVAGYVWAGLAAFAIDEHDEKRTRMDFLRSLAFSIVAWPLAPVVMMVLGDFGD